MATLAFEVEADYDKVIKLRDEINRLEQALNDMQGNGSEEAIAQLEAQLASARNQMRQTITVASELGSSIQKQSKDVADGANEILTAWGEQKMLNGMPFGTLEERIAALSTSIENNKVILADSAQQVNTWRQQAEEAFSQGNMGTMEAINADIEAQLVSMQELTKETIGYQEVLNSVMSLAGMSSQEVQVPRLFDSEEDLQRVNELKEKIVELQVEIARVGSEGGDTSALTIQLSETREELFSLQTQAAQTASELGEDLGNRASEAQQKLFAFNQAVEEQNKVVENLSKATEEAKANLESIKGAESATAQEIEQAAATYDTLSQSLSNAKDKLFDLQAQQEAAKGAWQDVSNEIESHDSKIVQMLGGYENYKAILDALPAPIRGVISGIGGMTKASKSFLKTPIGIAIGAITLALMALKTWFDNSLKGQEALTKAMGYFQGTLDVLRKIVMNVGEAIYNAFTNPKKAVSDLWNAIKTNIVNRIKGVGGMFTSLGEIIYNALNFNWDEAKNSFTKLGENYMKTLTGVEDAVGKTTNAIKKMGSEIKSAADTSSAQLQLQRDTAEWQATGRANSEARIQELLAQARDNSKSSSELEAIQKELRETIDKTTGKEMELAQRQKEIADANVARLGADNLSAHEQLLDAEKALSQANRYRASWERRLTMVNNRINTTSNRENRASSAGNRDAEREAQEQARAQQQLSDKILSIRAKNQQAEIDLMEEGMEKKLAQIEYDYQCQKDEIAKQAQELAELNQRAGTSGLNENGLTTEQQEELDQQTKLATEAYNKQIKEVRQARERDEQRAWNDYLIKYGNYLEQRQAIMNKYNQEISEAGTAGEVEMLKKEMEQQLYDLDNAAQQTTSLIAQMFADMSSKSIKEIRNIIDNAELLMSYLEGEKDENGNATINGQDVSRQSIMDLGITSETLDMLENSPEQIESLRKAIANLNKELGNKSPFEKLSKDLKDAWAMMKGDDMGAGIMKMADALKEFIPQVEQFGNDIGNIFGNDKIGESVNHAMEAFNGLLGMGMGIGQMYSGDIVGGIMSATAGLSSMVSALGSLFGSESDKTLHKDMEALTYSNEALKKSVDNLTDEMSKSTTSLTQATEDYATAKKNLEQMEADTADLMARAGASHRTGLFNSNYSSNHYINSNMTAADWEAVSEAAGVSVASASDFWNLTSEQMYKVSVEAAAQYAKIKQYASAGNDDAAQYMDDYIALWQELQDVTDAYYQKLTSTDFDSIVSNFQSAIMDMNHSAADFADDFENMMKNAVVSSLMSSTYASRLEQWYEDFANAMESGETLTAQEQNELKQTYMDIVADAQRDIEALYETLGWSREGYSQSATTGGFTTMSEDTGQELNGRFTALQEAGYQILAIEQENYSLMAEVTDISRENRTLLAESYLELQSINDNTADTVAQLLIVAKYLKGVKENTDKL